MPILNYPNSDILSFPNVSLALEEPDGLLCAGGNLSVKTLANAYENAIFPWFENLPILWWSPYERAIIQTDKIHISKNMGKLLKQNKYKVKVDTCFKKVIQNCSKKTRNRKETWITQQMQQAYINLFDNKLAHSFEVFDETNNLVGGLYGVFVKNIFCGESMFSNKKNTSKLALIKLSQVLKENNCNYIDCQLPTNHLFSMGANLILRDEFISILKSMSNNETLINTNWNKLCQP